MTTTISTKDSEEAAFLWTLDDRFTMIGTDITRNFGRAIVWFKFATELTEEAVAGLRADYAAGRMLVEPRKYAYRRAEVRNIILNTRRMM